MSIDIPYNRIPLLIFDLKRMKKQWFLGEVPYKYIFCIEYRNRNFVSGGGDNCYIVFLL